MPACGPGCPQCRLPRLPAASRRGVAGGRDQRFRTHIFAAHPAIRASKRNLLDAGALYASMSGSGSAVFGLFDRPEKAESLRSQTPFIFSVVGVARSWADVIPALAGALPGWPCAQAASGFHPAFAGTVCRVCGSLYPSIRTCCIAVRASHLFCLRGLCPYRIRCPARLSGLHLWLRAWHLSASHLCCPHSFLIRRRFPIGYFSAAPPQGTAIFSMRCWWRPPSNCAAK